MGKELIDIFSENLQRIMIRQGKTQADICRRFKISSATASDWYNGKKMPRADKLQALATWLGVGLSDLLEEKIVDYELFLALLEKTGKKTADVAKATGINPSMFSDWKKGRYSPKMDKLKKIADYFGIAIDYFTGEQEYYEDAEAKILADFLKENPEYKVLFDAAKNVKPSDIEFVRQFIERMGGKTD